MGAGQLHKFLARLTETSHGLQGRTVLYLPRGNMSDPVAAAADKVQGHPVGHGSALHGVFCASSAWCLYIYCSVPVLHGSALHGLFCASSAWCLYIYLQHKFEVKRCIFGCRTWFSGLSPSPFTGHVRSRKWSTSRWASSGTAAYAGSHPKQLGALAVISMT